MHPRWVAFLRNGI